MTDQARQACETAREAGFSISFEVFPARNASMRATLQELARRLAPFAPKFISVTYGAGGSSREATLETIAALMDAADIPVAGHLTCAQASREETLAVAARYVEMGVDRIVALRGDPPRGERVFRPHPEGFASARELVAALRERWPELKISVAAYPEVHPESPSREADLENLRAKLAAGADDALTQFFFDNGLFHAFMRKARAAGIDKPVIPGIMLMHDFFKVRNFARRCRTHVPEWLEARFRPSGNGELPAAVHRGLADAWAVEQTLDLAAAGIRRFHFYTMNRADTAEIVCRALCLAAGGTPAPGQTMA
jgi:methylenetetrahydrofolate reductase (NADPH)